MKPFWTFVLLVVASTIAVANAADHGHGKAVVHSENPVLQAEHKDLLDLVPASAVTHTAVKDGMWSDASTWKDGAVPGAKANVLIPKGTTVTLGHEDDAQLNTVRVDGTLRFTPDRDTVLRVDTLVVADEGKLIIGTKEEPIAADKSATITFHAGEKMIERRDDPKQLGRGLLSHGAVSIYGAAKTPYARLTRAPRKGDTKLTLAQAPSNWKKGDLLIIPATTLGGDDELRQIFGIDGTEISIEPLERDHLAPAEDLFVPVANLLRNVIIESESWKPDYSGHVMFMHSPDVRVENAAFMDLGRTNKQKPIDDPKFDDKKQLIAGTGTNPRGRYAVHFHRTGSETLKRPAVVKGCVITHSPGWGFVNHSSFVEIEDNITYGVVGSAFVTEAGDEIGTFRRNLAIRCTGSGDDVSARTKLQDFGHEGDGFWFQGAGVTVEDNIACGCASSGFIYFTSGLEQAGLGKMRFATANLKDPSWAGDKTTVEVGQVPVRSFKRNICFASHTGILPRHHLSGLKDGGPACPERSIFEDSVVWNSRIGVHVRYSANVTLRNLRLVADAQAKDRGDVGVIGQIEEIRDIHCENLDVRGWHRGVDVRESGSWVIDGGTYDNDVDILIPTTIERGRNVRITGDIRFAAAPKAPEHYDIYLGAEFGSMLLGKNRYRNPNHLFVPDVIEYQGRQLYYLEQAADHVPLRKDLTPAEQKRLGTAEGSVPEELIGKTNKELWDRYGLAIAGTIAPADAATAPRIHALIGPKAEYPQPEIINHPFESNELKDFQLVCFAAGKKKVAESEPTDLQPGWNLLSLTIADHRRSFLVYGGQTLKGKGYADKGYDKKGDDKKPKK